MDYDIVIIGGGVAGLTAGIYSVRAGKSVLIIENNYIGGTTATLEVIENYPGFSKISGIELVQKMYSQCIDLGVNFEFTNIKHIDFDKNTIELTDKNIQYKALIIASGSSPKKLNVENEETFLHKGLSYCAVCDGALFKNNSIIIITDNYSGVRAYKYLKNLTADLTILNLHKDFEMTENPNYTNVSNIELLGDNCIKEIAFISNGKSEKLKCDAVFVELGKSSDLSLFSGKIDIENGFIKSDDNCHTSVKNVFVAGDVRKKSLRQIITACADGAVASCEAIKCIS